MQRQKPSLVESAFTPGLKTACSVLALTVCLTAAGAQAADQGARRHARGAYDTVTATYAVVDGDELEVISERFEVPVEDLKAQNKLSSDELKKGQKLVIGAAADADPRPPRPPGSAPRPTRRSPTSCSSWATTSAS